MITNISVSFHETNNTWENNSVIGMLNDFFETMRFELGTIDETVNVLIDCPFGIIGLIEEANRTGNKLELPAIVRSDVNLSYEDKPVAPMNRAVKLIIKWDSVTEFSTGIDVHDKALDWGLLKN